MAVDKDAVDAANANDAHASRLAQDGAPAESQARADVLLGVSGSIAAYKACELLRLLQKSGLKVKVVMTKRAQEFVGAATFRALSGAAVAVDLFAAPEAPVQHISLAQEAKLLVIAPCTANVLNKLANGVADDLLTSTALAFSGALVLAPAMNQAMLQHPATQNSLRILDQRGAELVAPASGYLACGSDGQGRLADPELICAAVLRQLRRGQQLAGRKLLITAGPTREHIDPVRFISSPSSGKTGFALAREAARRGAEVTLVSGPVVLEPPAGVETIFVQTAEQMLQAAAAHFAAVDIAIFSAAVADFAPRWPAAQKIKKQRLANQQALNLELVPTPDILATLAEKKTGQFVVGFAAETADVLANAQAKLHSKGADLIVANDVSRPDLGFASDQNKVWLISSTAVQESEVLDKNLLAALILDKILAEMC